MSDADAVDEHVAQALATLGDVTARQLHATAQALERRRDCMGEFSSVFRDVAYSRKDGSDPHLAEFHIRQAVERGGDELAERIADAQAPFWRHVRDAYQANQPALEYGSPRARAPAESALKGPRCPFRVELEAVI